MFVTSEKSCQFRGPRRSRGLKFTVSRSSFGPRPNQIHVGVKVSTCFTSQKQLPPFPPLKRYDTIPLVETKRVR